MRAPGEIKNAMHHRQTHQHEREIFFYFNENVQQIFSASFIHKIQSAKHRNNMLLMNEYKKMSLPWKKYADGAPNLNVYKHALDCHYIIGYDYFANIITTWYGGVYSRFQCNFLSHRLSTSSRMTQRLMHRRVGNGKLLAKPSERASLLTLDLFRFSIRSVPSPLPKAAVEETFHSICIIFPSFSTRR